MVLWALLVVALLTMVAIVIDLGALRADRRADRAAADAAATAGANDLPLGADIACATAWHYALRNLSLNPTSYPSPCSGFPTCNPASPTAQSVQGIANGYRITISNPVLTGDPLLRAESIGSDIAQPADATFDGEPCDRLGVQISYTRQSTFGQAVGKSENTTTVHSVARYASSVGTGGEKPALVTLEQVRNCTIDVGQGLIHAVATGAQPALIYTDSAGTGANCGPGGDTVFEGGNGEIYADPSPTGVRGELGYFAPTLADAFSPDPNYDENGPGSPPLGARKVKLAERITRRPVDRIYHCGSVVPATPAVPGCTTGLGGTDLVADLEARYGNSTSAPIGFELFPGPAVAGDCANPPITFPAGDDWYINCPLFTVGHPVTFQDGDIVFAGNVEIISGGDLTINSLNAATVAPVGEDTVVVVRGTNGIQTSSNTWSLHWYRTLILMDNVACPATPASCGRLDIKNGAGTWTAPAEGSEKNLIYWSESTQQHQFEGNPLFTWEGVFFAGRSRFRLIGNAEVDAKNVQLWVDSVNVQNNSAKLLLRADPVKAISTSKAGSALIR